MKKEYLKKLFYSFLKGKEYTGKSVVIQNLSIIDKITETLCENNEEIKLDIGYRLDIIIEDKLIIEIKSVES